MQLDPLYREQIIPGLPATGVPPAWPCPPAVPFATEPHTSVQIVPLSPWNPKVPPPPPDEPPGVATVPREMLPARYADGTELKAEIKDGPNDVSFDLQ